MVDMKFFRASIVTYANMTDEIPRVRLVMTGGEGAGLSDSWRSTLNVLFLERPPLQKGKPRVVDWGMPP